MPANPKIDKLLADMAALECQHEAAKLARSRDAITKAKAVLARRLARRASTSGQTSAGPDRADQARAARAALISRTII